MTSCFKLYYKGFPLTLHELTQTPSKIALLVSYLIPNYSYTQKNDPTAVTEQSTPEPQRPVTVVRTFRFCKFRYITVRKPT